MRIKSASTNELKQIEILYEALFAEMASLQPKYIIPVKQDVAFIREAINEEDSDILIAEIDGCAVGFLLIIELITPPYTCLIQHKYAYISDMIVKHHYQNQGIGSALLSEAKKWAENRKLAYVELNVLSSNIRAIALYEKQGFKDLSHAMRFEL